MTTSQGRTVNPYRESAPCVADGRAAFVAHWDSFLTLICHRDIIDHEPADGNIFKMILGSLDSKYDEDTQTVSGDGDDDHKIVTTLAETEGRGEQGDFCMEPYACDSISPTSSRRMSKTGRSVAGSGAGFDGPRQAHTIQVGHLSRQQQPR